MMNFCMSHAPVGQRSAHRPQWRQRSSSLTMTRMALDRLGHEDGLIEIVRRRAERQAQFVLGRVRHEGNAVDRADVDAGVALDAGGRREDGLDVAVEAAARFAERLHVGEAELDFGAQVPERRRPLDVRHGEAAIERDRAVVGPVVNAHLLADEIGRRRGTDARVLAPAIRRRSRSPPRGRARPP